jgi:hypothetical protein
MFCKSLKADFRLLISRPRLLFFLFLPLILIIILKLFFPIIKDQLESILRIAPENWFTLAGITIISSVPVLTGAITAKVQSIAMEYTEDYRDNITYLLSSSFMSFSITFCLIVISSFIAVPVPSEGWLRLIFVSLLFSLFAIYPVLTLNRYLNKARHINIYILLSFFLICVPFGLLTSKPWNYISFMSPLYWINWAWIFPKRIESILAVSFALIFTGAAMYPLMIVLHRKRVK